MNIEFNEIEKCLNISITEEIDHHTTEKIRRKMDYEITRFMPRKVVFDFSKVSFMDSAGIGLLIGRYKLVKLIGGSAEISNANKSIAKVLEMSGIVKIIPIKSTTEDATYRHSLKKISSLYINKQKVLIVFHIQSTRKIKSV